MASALAPLGILRLCGALKSRARQLLLLGYHRVMPLGDGSRFHGDLELVSATPAEFEWQVEYLARRFEPVTFAQIAEALDGGRELPRRAVAITFDDGFADLREHAFPVLQRAKFPATVFVATGYVDDPQPFWFDLVAWLLMHAPVASVRVPAQAAPLPIADSERSRRSAAVVTLKWLKSCAEHERRAAVTELCERFPEAAEVGNRALGRALSWSAIRDAAAAGIELGSHTVSHPCLSRLEPHDLEHELTASKARLEEHVGAPVVALAYPFGGRSAFDDGVIAAARRSGYRVATTYIPGINSVSAAERFMLRRQHVERDTTRAYFEGLVNAPLVFS
jgi:peptidoglycan/xylan/chitin deacetylase (PgdA/CDA1 family)